MPARLQKVVDRRKPLVLAEVEIRRARRRTKMTASSPKGTADTCGNLPGITMYAPAPGVCALSPSVMVMAPGALMPGPHAAGSTAMKVRLFRNTPT